MGLYRYFLTLDTFGGEATCSSPDVVAVASANSAHFVVFWLTTSITNLGAPLWPFAAVLVQLYFTDLFDFNTLGGEATCSSPDVVAVSSANSAHFVVFWLTTSFGAALWPFIDIYLTLDTFGGEATPDLVAVAWANSAHFVVFWLTTSFGAALWLFIDIYLTLWGWSNMFLTWWYFLTLDTFGGEATCSSPDVVAVASANSAHFVVFWLTTRFGVALWPFIDIYLTLDTFGGEATCSSPDVVAVASANSAHFVVFWLTTSFWFADRLYTFGGEGSFLVAV